MTDFFRFKQFTVGQDRCAMKVGTDGVLLGAWARGGLRILDIGTGTGLIALMMAQRWPDAQVIGIDIDSDAASQAAANAASSPFSARTTIMLRDLKNMEGMFDSIVCNPPYFVSSLHSPDRQRTLARHADTLPYHLLMERSRQLLTDDGELSVVIAAEGKSLMESEAALAGLFTCREWSVATRPCKPTKRFLLAFRKHPSDIERQNLILGSETANKLTRDFYL